jgi:8-oxo-dGTP diphosphatase
MGSSRAGLARTRHTVSWDTSQLYLRKSVPVAGVASLVCEPGEHTALLPRSRELVHPRRVRAGKPGDVKPVKHSVAVVVRSENGTFLAVRRPDDPADPLAGVWGLPAITLSEGEDESAAVLRAGRVKLGVTLAVGRKLGEKTADRGSYTLRLSDYEAVVVSGTPSVPQADQSVTQYDGLRFVRDPSVLREAAGKGSLCCQIVLESGQREADPALETTWPRPAE